MIKKEEEAQIILGQVRDTREELKRTNCELDQLTKLCVNPDPVWEASACIRRARYLLADIAIK